MKCIHCGKPKENEKHAVCLACWMRLPLHMIAGLISGNVARQRSSLRACLRELRRQDKEAAK